MRLLISWVRDFIDLTASADEVAEQLALRGFEVASIEALDDDDAVIDFEVTANRPDCLSVIGFARELATVFDLPLRLPAVGTPGQLALSAIGVGDSDRLKVTIEDPDLCPRYVAGLAEVKPASTPVWMSARLKAAGVRPISAIVDVTNYVLMEMGHPMHAFDLARLAGAELRIRRARHAEAITTLDGVPRTLEPDMLVIADAERAQAIAGVMGGADSEVSGATRLIAIESAYFKPASVRRTSKRLGLKTEASSRFERGTDVNAPFVALQRAYALLDQIGAGRPLAPAIDRYPQPRAPLDLPLRRDGLSTLLGVSVPERDVERILRALGLDVSATAEGWRVRVPTVRVDLLREVDLIEEVGRHYGFDRIEATFPPLIAPPPPAAPRIAREQAVRRVLTAAGLSEAVTFGFIEAAAARPFSDHVIGLANPLSAKFDALRPSLLPGLVDAVAHNRRHGRRDVALFEIGARFSAASGETRGVAMAWTGASAPEHWTGAPRAADFFDAKGAVELVCSALGIAPSFEPAIVSYLTPGQTAAVHYHGSAIGVVGRMTPSLAENRGAPRQDAIFVAELTFDRLPLAGEAVRVQALPRHPFVVRDVSIVVSESLPAAIIRGTIQAAGAAHLTSIVFFDRYKGKGVADGSVSLSVRLTFQAADRTLTDADVQHSFDQILAALVREHQAVQR
jgi:phenylalanyl-tRNA synthetase beta chain